MKEQDALEKDELRSKSHRVPAERKAAVLAVRLCLHLPKLDAYLTRHADSFLEATLPYLHWSKKAKVVIRDLLREAEANPFAYEGEPRLDLDMEAAERVIAWMAKRHPALLKDSLITSLKVSDSDLSGPLPISTNVMLIVEVLGLTGCHAKLLEHVGLVATVPGYRSFLRSVRDVSPSIGTEFLAFMLQDDAEAVGRALTVSSPVIAYDLIKTDDSPSDLEDIAKLSTAGLPLFREHFRSTEELKAHYLKPCQPSNLSAADFAYMKGVVEHIARYLSQASAQGIRGINILLYGAPGTGKSELARVITEQAGFKAYLVPNTDNQGEPMKGSQRLGSFGLVQKFLSAARQTLIVFDEVEDVFPDGAISTFARALGLGGERHKDGKAWTNEVLENSAVPSIWITNSTGGIDPAYLRRFHFHLEVKVPPQAVRRQIAISKLQQMCEGIVLPEVADYLADDATLSIADMESAIRFGIFASTRNEEIPHLVSTAIAQHKRAAGRAAPSNPARRKGTPFDLTYLNVDASMPTDELIRALETQKGISMCFYGPPGTGKTSLAEHIADKLQRPLIVRIGSDLLSKYVGESEKAIASMFTEAADENAILLLDECDSFLASRDRARNNWEVTQTNELLQQMERHQGIFICATNRFEDLDAAVLRRLALKIHFKPLTLDQRLRLFAQEAMNGDLMKVENRFRSRLAGLEGLTPGDFAAVTARLRIARTRNNAEKYLEELGTEIMHRGDTRDVRQMGFI